VAPSSCEQVKDASCSLLDEPSVSHDSTKRHLLGQFVTATAFRDTIKGTPSNLLISFHPCLLWTAYRLRNYVYFIQARSWFLLL